MKTVTPSTQGHRGGGYHLLPTSWGEGRPLLMKSWAVGIRSIPGSAKHPTRVQYGSLK